ncbi:MAG: hypothetical protein ACKO23_02735 [Gemmataceae bacterium]
MRVVILLAGLMVASGGQAVAGEDTFQSGDILLFQTGGPLKNLGYHLAGSSGVTHSAIVVAHPAGGLALLESPGPRYPLMFSDLSTRLRYMAGKGKVWIRRRTVPLTAEENARLTAFACSQEDKKFASLRLLKPVICYPSRKHGPRELPEWQLDRTRWFCSELVAAACISAGLLDRSIVKPRYVDPEDLFSDRFLDLRPCWESPCEWCPAEPSPGYWLSRAASGSVSCWK